MGSGEIQVRWCEDDLRDGEPPFCWISVTDEDLRLKKDKGSAPKRSTTQPRRGKGRGKGRSALSSDEEEEVLYDSTDEEEEEEEEEEMEAMDEDEDEDEWVE